MNAKQTVIAESEVAKHDRVVVPAAFAACGGMPAMPSRNAVGSVVSRFCKAAIAFGGEASSSAVIVVSGCYSTARFGSYCYYEDYGALFVSWTHDGMLFTDLTLHCGEDVHEVQSLLVDNVLHVSSSRFVNTSSFIAGAIVMTTTWDCCHCYTYDVFGNKIQ